MTTKDQPPIVLLHGWGGSFKSTWLANGWVDAIEASGRKVIEIDLPGHGAAGGSIDPEAYSDLAAEVCSKIPENTIVDAIGYSLGAKLVLALAARDQNQYRRIVVAGLGANVFAPERLGDIVATALENGPADDTPVAVRKLVDYALGAGNDPRAVAAVLRRPPNPVFSQLRLMGIKCPTLVIAGDQDAIAMPLEPLLEALPHAVSRILPGVDHLSLPAQRGFRDTALKFLS